MPKKENPFFIWLKKEQLEDIPTSATCVQVNFNPSAKNLHDLLKRCPNLGLLQFMPCVFREKLSSHAKFILNLAFDRRNVRHREGRIRDLKYPEDIREYAGSQDRGQTYQQISDDIHKKFGIRISRQLVWYWRNRTRKKA